MGTFKIKISGLYIVQPAHFVIPLFFLIQVTATGWSQCLEKQRSVGGKTSAGLGDLPSRVTWFFS
jgi:hypothetical protein